MNEVKNSQMVNPRAGVVMGAPKCESRRPIAFDVMDHIERVSAQLQIVADRIDEKLSLISRSAGPCEDSIRDTCEMLYPPFFDRLRAITNAIECSSNRIGEAIDRVEF